MFKSFIISVICIMVFAINTMAETINDSVIIGHERIVYTIEAHPERGVTQEQICKFRNMIKLLINTTKFSNFGELERRVNGYCSYPTAPITDFRVVDVTVDER